MALSQLGIVQVLARGSVLSWRIRSPVATISSIYDIINIVKSKWVYSMKISKEFIISRIVLENDIQFARRTILDTRTDVRYNVCIATLVRVVFGGSGYGRCKEQRLLC